VHHSDTARVTQVWWDGVKQTINFRQSRVLNIAAESFLATDVLLLVAGGLVFHFANQSTPTSRPRSSHPQLRGERQALRGREAFPIQISARQDEAAEQLAPLHILPRDPGLSPASPPRRARQF
jgi:hypothetical protein